MKLLFASIACVFLLGYSALYAQEIFIDPNFSESTTVILPDGAQSNNIDDEIVKVSLSKVNKTTLQVKVVWKAINNDINSSANGISIKAFHIDGFSFTPIFFKHFPAGTFSAGIENIESFQFSVPIGFATDTQFIRVSLIDNCIPFEDIVGTFACDTCGSSGCSILDFDNVDVPFLFQACSIDMGVVANSICIGATFDVSYQVGTLQNCFFNPSNQFHVVLSDSTGSFNNPTIIGSLNSIIDGTISATIPNAISPASGYRIRVVSDNPFLVSEENGADITLLPTPLADFTVASNCLGDASNILNQSVFASGTLNYFWDFGDGTQSQNASPSKTFSADGFFLITLITNASNGCADTVTRNHQVLQRPISGFITQDVCLGDSASFTNTTFGTSVTFQWDFGDGTFSSLPNPNHFYLNSGQYQVQLIARNTNNCSDTFQNTITVFDSPQASFSLNNACLGNEILFVNQSSINSGVLNYFWDFGDGTQTIDIAPKKNYATADTFTVQLIAVSNNACADTSEQDVIVFENTQANFSVSAVCLGDSSVFMNLSSGNIAAYLWDFGDGNFSTDSMPLHLYQNDGLFAVTLITSNANCSDTITKTAEVFSAPVSAFSASNNCFGTPTVFQNQSTINNGIMSFVWDFGEGNVSANPDPTHLYQQAGNFSASLLTISEKGCTDTSFLPINIYEQPQAGFTASNVCFGDTVFFTNTTLTNVPLQYNWFFGDGDTAQIASPQHFYATADTFRTLLVVTTAEACADSAALLIQVFHQPIADFDVANSCLGTPTVFDNQSQVFFTNTVYEWDFGNGNTSNVESPVFTYDSIGIFQVSLKISNASGCYDSINQPVIIFPTPIADFNANVACFGKDVFFTDTSSIEFGTLQYRWNFGDGSPVDTLQNPVHTYQNLGVFNVSLHVASDEGCSDEIVQPITVHPVPTAQFLANSVCENDTLHFENFSTISNGSLNFYWDLGEGFVSTETNPAQVFQNSNGVVATTLIATSNQGCADTITKNTSLFSVPIVDFEAENICWPSSVFLNADIETNTSSVKNIFWDFGDGTDANQASIEKQYQTPETYTIRLQVEALNGCVGVKEKTIIVYPKPDATIRILGRAAFCRGEETLLSAGTQRDNFVWSTLETSQDIIVREPGTYQVTVSNDFGCSDSAATFITVYELPQANAGEDVSVSKGFGVQLNASGGIDFEWSPAATLDNENIFNPTADPLETTTYTVTVTDRNGCQNTDEVVVTVLNDFRLEVTNVMTANGDGVNDFFEIFNIENYPQAELKIYDRWGTEVFKAMPYLNDWDGKHSGNKLPDGTYYYVIKLEGIDILYKGSISILR